MKKNIWHDVLEEALRLAVLMVANSKNGNKVIRAGATFGDMNNDTEIKADQEIGEMLVEYFSNPAFGISHISCEGMVDFEMAGATGTRWVCIDPLDGSLNYKMKGATIGLPYSTCITILSKKDKAYFDDVLAAGVIDLRCGDMWLALSDGEGHVCSVLNGKTARTESRNLDLGSMIVVGEMYYPENREKVCKIFQDTKGWLRSPGSAAYEMALVASGQVAAFICDRQKEHELGAAYALVKGAGGVAVDFDGNDIGQKRYLFNTQIPVILAGNRRIADEILRRYNKQ